MTEEDRELELLKAKRLLEMQKNIANQQKQEELKVQKPTLQVPSPREVLIQKLGHRGLEVLQNAESQFPNETKLVVVKLAELIQSGEVIETLDGGKLLAIFRSIGIRVRVETTIHVEEDGKLVSWSDKLKEPTIETEEIATQETSEQNTL